MPHGTPPCLCKPPSMVVTTAEPLKFCLGSGNYDIYSSIPDLSHHVQRLLDWDRGRAESRSVKGHGQTIRPGTRGSGGSGE